MNNELIKRINYELRVGDSSSEKLEQILRDCRAEIERLHNQNTELRELVEYWVTHIKANGDLGITFCKINGVDVATNWMPKAIANLEREKTLELPKGE